MPNSEDRCPSCGAELKHAFRKESICSTKGKEANSGRVLVRITSFRCRLIDYSNLCPKYFIDAARYSGFFRDDSPEEIIEEIAQVQVVSKSEQRTEIEIIYPAGYSLVNQKLFP